MIRRAFVLGVLMVTAIAHHGSKSFDLPLVPDGGFEPGHAWIGASWVADPAEKYEATQSMRLSIPPAVGYMPLIRSFTSPMLNLVGIDQLSIRMRHDVGTSARIDLSLSDGPGVGTTQTVTMTPPPGNPSLTWNLWTVDLDDFDLINMAVVDGIIIQPRDVLFVSRNIWVDDVRLQYSVGGQQHSLIGWE